jgi:hypothetical protein
MRHYVLFASLAVLSFAASKPAFAISISYNGSCVSGDCSNPVGNSPVNFSYNTTFSNGDVYNAAGTVQDHQYQQYGYSFLGETFTLTYVGNAAQSTSAGNDVVNFDVMDIFGWFYDLAAVGTQAVSVNFSSGFNSKGYVKGQYSISNMPGAPFSPLSFRPSNDLNTIVETRPVTYLPVSYFPPATYDENLNVSFGAGTLPGTSVAVDGVIYTLPAPEPAEIQLCLAAMTSLAFWRRRFIRRSVSRAAQD